jgi:hypothetical protein
VNFVGWGQIQYLALALGLVVMLVCIAKLALFVHDEGIKLSIAQIVIANCFCAGLFWFVMVGLFGSINLTVPVIVPGDAQGGTLFMTLGFVYTAVVTLSFYFIEISALTKSSIKGLDKMKIPAIVFLAITWAVVISADLVEAIDPVYTAAGGISAGASQTLLFNFFFAWLGVIVPFMCTAVLVFGTVSLLMAIRGSNNTGAIWRLSFTAVWIILMVWCFCLPAFLIMYVPGFSLATYPAFMNFTPSELFGMRTLFWTIGYMGIALVLPLNFSLSVSKEIELSKSATSSTSSSSSSRSGSSTSSSASSDPVIEL